MAATHKPIPSSQSTFCSYFSKSLSLQPEASALAGSVGRLPDVESSYSYAEKNNVFSCSQIASSDFPLDMNMYTHKQP